MNKTVLITGASGSIGTKLREHFDAMQWPMRLLCLNPKQDPVVLSADLTTYDEAWARHFADVDAVIHLAGNPYPDASWAAVQSNIDLTLNVFRAALEYGAPRIVFASSNWVMAGYRFGPERLTTQLPPWPINPYGSAKLFCERAGRQWAEQHRRSFIALRIGYGSVMRIPLALLLAGVVLAAIHYTLSRTIAGRWLYAIGHNGQAARISGVPVRGVTITAFVASGLCAALASVIYTSRIETGLPTLGSNMLLDIVGAAIIGGVSLFGGRGSVWMALMGVAFLGVLDKSLQLLGLSLFLVLAIKGLAILLAAILDAQRQRRRRAA